MWPSLEITQKTLTVAITFVFITLDMSLLFVPIQHCHNLDPVVITWNGRAHELDCDASPISLVERCVTFRHDRRLLSLLGFVHNWPTIRWSAKKKKKKKKNGFH